MKIKMEDEECNAQTNLDNSLMGKTVEAEGKDNGEEEVMKDVGKDAEKFIGGETSSLKRSTIKNEMEYEDCDTKTNFDNLLTGKTVEHEVNDNADKIMKDEGKDPGESIFNISGETSMFKKPTIKIKTENEVCDIQINVDNSQKGQIHQDKGNNYEDEEMDDCMKIIDVVYEDSTDESSDSESKGSIEEGIIILDAVDNNPDDESQQQSQSGHKNEERNSSTSKSKRTCKTKDRYRKSESRTSCDSGRNLCVSGLAGDTKENYLQDRFSEYGKVECVKIVSIKEKCYGFITMATRNQASMCIRKLNRSSMHGYEISVMGTRHDPITQAKKLEAEAKDGNRWKLENSTKGNHAVKDSTKAKGENNGSKSNPVADVPLSEVKIKVKNEAKTSGGAVQESQLKASSSQKKKQEYKVSTKISKPDNERRRETDRRNLCVSQLTPTTTESHLEMIFSKYGKVERVKIIANPDSSECYGFVTMATSHEAFKCICRLKKKKVEGKYISVNYTRHDPSTHTWSGKITTRAAPKQQTKEGKNSTSKSTNHSTGASSQSKDLRKITKFRPHRSAERNKGRSRDRGKGRSPDRSSDRVKGRSRKRSRSRSRDRRSSNTNRSISRLEDKLIEQRRKREVELRERERRRQELQKNRKLSDLRRGLKEPERNLIEPERNRREDPMKLDNSDSELLRIELDLLNQEKVEVLRLERDKARLQRALLEREMEELARRAQLPIQSFTGGLNGRLVPGASISVGFGSTSFNDMNDRVPYTGEIRAFDGTNSEQGSSSDRYEMDGDRENSSASEWDSNSPSPQKPQTSAIHPSAITDRGRIDRLRVCDVGNSVSDVRTCQESDYRYSSSRKCWIPSGQNKTIGKQKQRVGTSLGSGGNSKNQHRTQEY